MKKLFITLAVAAFAVVATNASEKEAKTTAKAGEACCAAEKATAAACPVAKKERNKQLASNTVHRTAKGGAVTIARAK